MAGGGGGFSPEAQCGAEAVESHKGEPFLAEGFGLVGSLGRGRERGRGNHCGSSLGGASCDATIGLLPLGRHTS